jgi:hypothetical protein
VSNQKLIYVTPEHLNNVQFIFTMHRVGNAQIRIGSAFFYNGHLTGQGNLQRSGTTDLQLSPSRSSLKSGLMWEGIELVYDIEVEVFGLIRQPRRLSARIESIGFEFDVS